MSNRVFGNIKEELLNLGIHCKREFFEGIQIPGSRSPKKPVPEALVLQGLELAGITGVSPSEFRRVGALVGEWSEFRRVEALVGERNKVAHPVGDEEEYDFMACDVLAHIQDFHETESRFVGMRNTLTKICEGYLD